jgi:hypothetical protein
MASKEQRNTVLFYLGLTGGLIALVTVIGTGANHSGQGAEATSRRLQNTEPTADSLPNTPNSYDYKNGYGCETLMFTQDGRQLYVTVPDVDAERIQQEIDRGDFRSVDNLKVCGERGEIFLNNGITANFEVTEVPQAAHSEDNQQLVQDQLNAKAIGDIFEVVDKDGSIYKVQKTAGNQFNVLEVIEDHKSIFDPAERIIVLPRTIRQVR